MNKKESIIKSFFVLLTGTGLSIIIGTLTTPIITRIVKPSEYGQLSFFTMYSNLMYVLILLGFDQALVRYFYEKKTVISQGNLLYNLIKFPLFLATIVLCGCFFIRNKINLFESYNEIVLVFLGLNVLILILFRFAMLVVRLKLKTKLFSSLNILHKLIFITLTLTMIIIFNDYYLIILTFTTFFSVLITTIIAIIYEHDIWYSALYNRKKLNDFGRIAKYSIPFIFSSVISWSFEAVDKFSIKLLSSYEEVGIYASATTITGLFSVIATTFTTLWVPIAMQHYTEKPHDTKIFKLANQGVTVVMYYLGIFLILFKDMFALFLGKSYRDAAYIIPCLMFNPIMVAISETTVNGINFKEKSFYHIIVTTISLIINTISNMILVPLYGSVGAAIATGFSYIIFFAMRTYLSCKLYYVDYSINKFFIITISIGVYAVYNCFNKTDIISLVMFIINFLLILFLYKDIHMLGFKLLKNKLYKKKE